MTSFDPQLVQRRLEDFRQNLLDTSLRNRLINFRARTKAGRPLEKVVEIFGEDPVQLLRMLVAEGKAMSFTGRPDPVASRKTVHDGINDYGDQTSLELLRRDAEHELNLFLETGQEVASASDLKLNSDDTASSLLRKLTKIARDAKVAVEEQGVNILFLALGSLDWYESADSEELRRAPLILLPVSLERTNAGAFRLRWDGTDPGPNLSIASKVRSEFGIRLPEMPDELDAAAYFREIKGAVASQPRWSVDDKAVALAFFSYNKFLMYRDLDPSSWPADDQPANHAVLGCLLDSGFEEDETGIPEDAFLDPLRPVSQVCEVYDADGSQTLAILEAGAGRTMVIEGPPGTGKSQTITNMIAEAIGAGKKVLFVAEKAAALDVVYRRLREANLEDACLELHSHKANKRNFYTELKKTVEVAPPKTAQADADLKRLEEDRNLLNDYADAINEPLAPFEISPRFAMGKLVALGPEPSPEGRHDFTGMESWSETVFQERLDAVLRLQRHVAGMGRPVDHPYYGCALDHLLPADREDIARKLAESSEACERFHLAANALAEALRVELPVRPDDLDRLREFANFVAHAPDVKGVAIDSQWGITEPVFRRAIADGREFNATIGSFSPSLSPIALDTDLTRFQAALRLDSVLKGRLNSLASAEIQGVLIALDAASAGIRILVALAEQTAARIGSRDPNRLDEITLIADLAKRVGSAPDVRGIAVTAVEWKGSGSTVREALGRVRRFAELRSQFGSVLKDSSWNAEVRNDLATLEEQGTKLFRFFNAAYKSAKTSTDPLFQSPPSDTSIRVNALKAIVESKSLTEEVDAYRGRVSFLFGDRWQSVNSDWKTLSDAASWIEEAKLGGKIPNAALAALEGGESPAELRRSGDELANRLSAVRNSLDDLRRAIVALGLEELPEGIEWQESLFQFILRDLHFRLLELNGLIPGADKISLTEALAQLDRLLRAQLLRTEIRSVPGGAASFGPRWQTEATNWPQIEEILNWVVGLHRSVVEGSLPAGLVAFFAEERPRAGLDVLVRKAQENREVARDTVSELLSLARLDRDPDGFTRSPIGRQRERIKRWVDRLDDLPTLIYYNALAESASRTGLQETVALANSWSDANTRLAESFERSWYTGVVRKAIQARPILAKFDRNGHEATVAEFRNLDDLSLRYNRAKVALAHWRSVPRGVAGGAMGWLGIQFNLRQNHKPVRLTMERAGEAVQAIKPVFLMSPLSVAMYLPADGPRFDLVIFDEASQVKPEDGFGALLRGRQTIVVGDSKQMPPTSFFEKLTSEEVEIEEEEEPDDLGGAMKDLESLLAMMSSKLPARSPRRRDLRWHYRSRHDALIATSNRLFYDDRLIVFPSPQRAGAGAGLILRHNPKSVYGRGGSRKNLEEARAVSQAALKHVVEHPKLTLGIAAFSKPQQEAIQDELDRLRRQEPAFAAFDAEHPYEPLFVKNLENVQGDERDVIFISVGYGRDEIGYVPASFGPLNREGGERRLNVLITRARIRCEVFTNLKAEDMRVSDNSSRGVSALRTFLSFADTGSLNVPSAVGQEPQSPFEEAVMKRLVENGYHVEAQVGSSGFYIDMAIRHPEDLQRFILGIECDGSMYRRARSARDRDKLRRLVLEARGWRLHRIWSTDWFQNQEREYERLVQAIEASLSRTEDDDDTEQSARPSEFVELERDAPALVEEDIQPYRLSELQIDLDGVALHLLPKSQLADSVDEVVKVESPVHVDEVTRRIREAAGVLQTGPRIRAAIEDAIAACENRGTVVRRENFLYLAEQSQITIRTRAGLPASAKRLEMISPEEIGEALSRVVRKSFGIKLEEAIVLAARSLGFERTTASMADHIRGCVAECVACGKIENADGLLRIGQTEAV